jgi:hypothetical protein
MSVTEHAAAIAALRMQVDRLRRVNSDAGTLIEQTLHTLMRIDTEQAT